MKDDLCHRVGGVGGGNYVVGAGRGGVAVECCSIAMETGYGGRIFAEFVVHGEEVFNLEAIQEDFGSGEVICSDTRIYREETDVKFFIGSGYNSYDGVEPIKGFADFLLGRFILPYPGVEVTGMEYSAATYSHCVGIAGIRRWKGPHAYKIVLVTVMVR